MSSMSHSIQYIRPPAKLHPPHPPDTFFGQCSAQCWCIRICNKMFLPTLRSGIPPPCSTYQYTPSSVSPKFDFDYFDTASSLKRPLLPTSVFASVTFTCLPLLYVLQYVLARNSSRAGRHSCRSQPLVTNPHRLCERHDGDFSESDQNQLPQLPQLLSPLCRGAHRPHQRAPGQA